MTTRLYLIIGAATILVGGTALFGFETAKEILMTLVAVFGTGGEP
jgi:hypothetical protein